MRRLLLAFWIAGSALASGCQLRLSDRACSTDEDCVRDGMMGSCLASPTSSSQWCAFSVDLAECSSTLEWGPLSGDGLAGICVSTTVDGSLDAPAQSVDAAPDAEVRDPRVLIPAAETDEVYVYATMSLTALPSIILPDRAGTGSRAIGIARDTVFVISEADITALDPGMLSVLPGYPLPLASCDAARVVPLPSGFVFSGDAIFCTSQAMGRVFRLEGDPITQVDSADITSPILAAGSARRLLVPYGTGSPPTVEVFDGASLVPMPGSPLTFSVGAGPMALAVDDVNFRIAAGAGTELRLYNSESLEVVNRVTYAAGVYPASLAFDVPTRSLVVGFNQGQVAAYDSVDLTELVPPTQRARPDYAFATPYIDGDRVYAIDVSWTFGSEWRLLVLDLMTLDHVAGSPLVLPGKPAGLAIVH
jgi:hypothetical protein